MYDLLARFANNQGVVKPALYVGIVVLLLNAGFNYLFIYVFGLGYRGSPLATCTSRWLSPLLLGGYLYRQGLLKQSWFGWRWREAVAWRQVATFFRLGVPAAGIIVLEVTGFHLSTIFVTTMHNEVFLAAHVTMFSILFVVFFVPLGVSVGCAQRVGSALGDARRDDAKYSARVAIGATVVLAALVSAGLLLLRNQVPHLLTDDPAIVGNCCFIIFVFLCPSVLICISQKLRRKSRWHCVRCTLPTRFK
jgi:MATE family multidrug resistance protein